MKIFESDGTVSRSDAVLGDILEAANQTEEIAAVASAAWRNSSLLLSLSRAVPSWLPFSSHDGSPYDDKGARRRDANCP